MLFSLDASGRPVPIVNSDETLALLFAKPEPATLDRDVASVMRPFPLGLLTDAGMVVANPVFADHTLKARFTNHAYHGTVVWSWQQALFASGLERQLERTDLPGAFKTASADRATNTLASHPSYAIHAKLGIVELAFRGRPLPCRTVRLQRH